MAPTEQPTSDMISNLKTLFEITTADDGISDVTFNLKNGSCSAHRYILANRCPSFDKIAQSNLSVIKLDDIDFYVFRQFLSLVYTGSCDRLLQQTKQKDSVDQNNDVDVEGEKKTKEHPLEGLRRVTKDFGCGNLFDSVKNGRNNIAKDQSFVFNRLQFPHLYDITLKCADGELKAHRCILSSRMEYFGNMLSDRWSGVGISL